ncbi:hypothetical protein AB4305_20635 [Nocardia sp. 2YAB30]|uniref:hypothetical protein n=1 Tax=unclassified Nocardia TaxID=2637762 RepID=UPI003F9C61E8
MASEDGSWLIRVRTGGDTLRAERLTRELRDELDAADGIAAGFIEGGAAPATGDRKGGVDSDLVLWASVSAPVAAAGARVLTTLIKEWCARDRHRRVELTYKGNSAIIAGQSADQLQQIVELFASAGDANDSDDPAHGQEASTS